MADIKALVNNLASIAIPAMRTFALTLFCMLLLGMILFAPSFAIASAGAAGWGALAGFLALGIAGALGFMMAQKRAIATGLMVAVEKYQAGSQAVLLLFSKIPQIEAAQGIASLLPFAEAERLFRGAVAEILGAPEQDGGAKGFIKRKIQENLFEKITSVTLSEFRAAGGGVDLLKARDAIAAKADTAVKERLAGMKSSSYVFVIAAILASLLVAVVIRVATTRP